MIVFVKKIKIAMAAGMKRKVRSVFATLTAICAGVLSIFSDATVRMMAIIEKMTTKVMATKTAPTKPYVMFWLRSKKVTKSISAPW